MATPPVLPPSKPAFTKPTAGQVTGTGNVTLYIDGAEVATTSAGPTGMGTSNAAAYREQVEAATTPAVRGIIEATGGWLYIE